MKAVSEPAAVYFDLTTRALIAIKPLDQRQLLVAYVKKNEEIHVVTTFKTSAGEQIATRKEAGGTWLRIR